MPFAPLDDEAKLIRLSQSHLNLLETCPPQFQQLHLEQLGSPISAEQQEKTTWGSQFHLLMQQRELGLPIDELEKEKDNQTLYRSLQALVKATSEIWQPEVQISREAEHIRTLSFQGYLLTAIYDLLILQENQAQIFDWKTYLQPENKSKLTKNWQTRLYLYILAETSEYLPEQISLTYWFVKLPNKPKSLTFNYTQKQHQKTHQDLSILLTKLTTWLENYENKGTPFPHLANCEENCPYYSTLINSQNTLEKEDNLKVEDWLKFIDDMEEISM